MTFRPRSPLGRTSTIDGTARGSAMGEPQATRSQSRVHRRADCVGKNDSWALADVDRWRYALDRIFAESRDRCRIPAAGGGLSIADIAFGLMLVMRMISRILKLAIRMNSPMR
jgi:hypothetical protein